MGKRITQARFDPWLQKIKLEAVSCRGVLLGSLRKGVEVGAGFVSKQIDRTKLVLMCVKQSVLNM